MPAWGPGIWAQRRPVDHSARDELVRTVEIKLKRNWNKKVSKLFQNSRETFLTVFSQSQAGIGCLRKTAVYDAVNRTLITKHGDHIPLVR